MPFRSISVDLVNISVSFMTLSELYYGAYKSQYVDENIAAINLLAAKLSIVESNDEICACFGNLKALLEKQGMIIDDADLFIAACALTTGAILVTNNIKHFKRIKINSLPEKALLPQEIFVKEKLSAKKIYR
jgi:tRNA(fMet)-specific endonuclease VapC